MFNNDIQIAVGVACDNPNTIPDIEFLTPQFRFNKYFIPPKSSAMHIQGKNSYLCISRALKKKMMHGDLILDNCKKLINKRHTYNHEKDGF